LLHNLKKKKLLFFSFLYNKTKQKTSEDKIHPYKYYFKLFLSCFIRDLVVRVGHQVVRVEIQAQILKANMLTTQHITDPFPTRFGRIQFNRICRKHGRVVSGNPVPFGYDFGFQKG